jgi:CDP-glycerol glycerophosphotransferase
VRVGRTPSGRLGIRLRAPLADDELGAYAQQQLQDWLADEKHELDETAVYFQAYVGQSPTDSGLAIHTELHRTRPDLTLYWGVADYSAFLHEGAVPVLLNSRKWYDVLATAKHLVSNHDFERWFRRQPDQKLLQTFHGYPAKTMGVALWTAKQFTPRRIALELEQTAGEWTLILTPTPAMDRYYREEYLYEGEIHNEGYPRDDVLTSADADRIRRDTRRRLGIGDGQTAVLYAPTWRDHLALRFRSAKIANYLDLESASAALGDDYVLLMRGHRFHAQANRRARATRILDVTDYPEINDLILAADVGVLDYSSLRFDFGLTGKPMIFLVPDLGLYTGGVRGFLYDYDSTAPGPLLDTADEVVAALKDLDSTSADFAEDRRRFIEQYHYWQDGKATERVVQRFFAPTGLTAREA